MKDRLRKLLGAGVSPVLAASAVGCDVSYISQLFQDEEFALSVATLRCADLEELRQRDGKYDAIEDALLDRLESLLPMMLQPRQIIHALQIVNAAKRRSQELVSGQQQQVTINNIVQLSLPEKTIRTFELSSLNEIVAIDNKALVAMPTSALLKELREEAQEVSKNDCQRETVPALSKRVAESEISLSSI